ncbi:MAG TPA: VWA domain-containing protein [Candidatus Baltobacteraceae bacterium]|nr:VWA domain-containing protein [Candidatus Baltobacteraceae bacterium]
MSFDDPWRLWVGAVVVALLAAFYMRAERRKTANDLAYSNLQFFARSIRARTWIPGALRAGWIGALVALVIAAAGPHVRLPLPTRDGSVFICIDTSGSMQSSDVTPTRAAAATAAARTFIHEAPPGVKIGIIAFATTAEVLQPLSADHDAVSAALDQLPAPNGATAIGDALRLAANGLPATGHRVVILITDGVNNTGVDPQAMAQYLGAHHVPIYTVGIGTPNGDIIGGEQSTIDEGALQGYADASGGSYVRAENAGQLRDALARLGNQVTIEPTRTPAALEFAYAGAVLLALTLLGGLAAGRFP